MQTLAYWGYTRVRARSIYTEVLDDVGAEEDDDEGGGADHGGVVAHEDLVILS